MTVIYIARHGQDEDNVRGILNGHRNLPLTDLGRQQAQQLARRIRDRELVFDVVYASPLDRALETAAIVATELGLAEPIVHDDLIERNFGIMTGRPAADVEEMCAPDIIKTENVTYFLNPDGAETFPELLARGQWVLDSMACRHPDQTVLLVCHGDIGKMIYAAATNMPWRRVLTDFYFGNTDIVGPVRD
ncbi:histidine phosphatase family protein [Candidatus Nanosynbacter lyticus]|uniref:histidine phosphatase family protein n=1 Tax=Candidatus Nanosynbacter lyticus TaxID=2093824 RepID=UPI0025533EEE|nr:histidine phosphatase family protein [Candidatus Nanosynbacter lyticus]WLD46641.1 histidine phosphatase family protein [Candidatus Nanosynbacter lyticus]